MARLALGLVGAAVGSFVGQPGLGFAIGGALGGALFPTKLPGVSQEGPRLADLKVQASSYGVGIPVCAGTVRLAGNMIWTSGIREQVNTTVTEVESGGGGGKGGRQTQQVTQTTYSYFASFAIGLCAGPIVAIRRIWADGELIFDGASSDANAIAAGGGLVGTMSTYVGSETQLPNGTMEAYLGAGNVPAHRGLAYVVFADADITAWGRIPSFEFEVAVSGTTTVPNFLASAQASTGNAGYYDNGLVYTSENAASAAPATTAILRTLTPAGALVSQETWQNTTYSHSGVWGTYVPRSNIRALLVPAGKSPTFFQWLRVTAAGGAVFTNCDVPIGIAPISMPGVYRCGSTVLMVLTFSADRYLHFFRWDDNTELPQSTPFATIVQSCGSNAEAQRCSVTMANGSFYVAHLFSGTFTRRLQQFSAAGVLLDTWTFTTGASDLTTIRAIAVVDDLYFVSDDAGGANDGYMMRLYAGGTYDVLSSGHGVNINGTQFAVGIPGLAWSPNGIARLLPTVTTGSTTLGPLVSGLCQKAGLTAGDLDVSALTDTVYGYTVARPMTARAAIELLQKAFFFDGVESDLKLKFVKRGGASLVTIPADDLDAKPAGQAAGDTVALERADEVEAPRQVVVAYWNRDAALVQATEYARRLVVRSVEQVFEELPIALSATEASRVADVLLYAAHLARTGIRFSTSAKYAKYEPTDVLTVTATSGATYPVRIVRKTERGQRIDWEAVLEDAPAYTSASQGAAAQPDDTAIGVGGPALFELLDIPLLRDADDNAGYYAAMAGVLAGWRGGVLLASADDVDFAQVGAVVASAAIGVATTVLPNFSGGNVFDEISTVNVQLSGGALSSVTRLQALAGSNAALLGSEIIIFRTATLVSGTTYRLTGLLRGRFGTEPAMATHATGERFVLLYAPGMIRTNRPAAELNVLRYLRGVSYGQNTSDATSKTFTNTGVGLKPLAPAYVAGYRDAAFNWVLSWVRRTRVGGEWRDYVDATLGEAAESYEVDIMQGGTVKRTLTSSTPTVTYTVGQQTTDFGAAQSSITVRVYQVSATVGRGFVTQKTL